MHSNMEKKYIFLAGMHRAGSTLLTSILNQNPSIFASSSSPVCNVLYWSNRLWSDQIALQANPNPMAVQAVLGSMIPSFYSTRPEQIIIDKGFNWGVPENLSFLTNALGYVPKFIVMDRPVNEVFDSYNELLAKSPDFVGNIHEFMQGMVLSHDNLLKEIPEQCFVVNYKRLCNDTQGLLNEFYGFIDEPIYSHDLSYIVNTNTDNDKVWGLIDMHEIRPTIGEK